MNTSWNLNIHRCKLCREMKWMTSRHSFPAISAITMAITTMTSQLMPKTLLWHHEGNYCSVSLLSRCNNDVLAITWDVIMTPLNSWLICDYPFVNWLISISLSKILIYSLKFSVKSFFRHYQSSCNYAISLSHVILKALSLHLLDLTN